MRVAYAKLRWWFTTFICETNFLTWISIIWHFSRIKTWLWRFISVSFYSELCNKTKLKFSVSRLTRYSNFFCYTGFYQWHIHFNRNCNIFLFWKYAFVTIINDGRSCAFALKWHHNQWKKLINFTIKLIYNVFFMQIIPQISTIEHIFGFFLFFIAINFWMNLKNKLFNIHQDFMTKLDSNCHLDVRIVFFVSLLMRWLSNSYFLLLNFFFIFFLPK